MINNLSIKTLLTSLIVSSLLGCTSPQIQLNYYSLHMPASQLHTHQSSTITVGDVLVSEYLQQPSLVMKIDSHQLYYSPQDLWAESLNTAYKKTLQQALNQHVSNQQTQQDQPASKVHVALEHFYISDQSKVVASGLFWFSTISGSDNPTQYPFHIQQALSADGYHHGVTQLVATVERLAEQIVEANKSVN